MATVHFRNIDEKEQGMFEDAVKFVIKKFIPRLDKKLDIEITGVRDMDVYGNCDWIDHNIRPRMFDIELATEIDTTKRLSTLFHELVHMKQFAKGELINYMGFRCDGVEMLTNKDVVKWQGKRFKIKNIDYYDLPWEIEAHGREVGLMNNFLEKYKKYKDLIDLKKLY